jgi:predicted transcriptional regulator
VVLHGSGPEEVDELAKRIAQTEGIPLATNRTGNVEELLALLKKTFGGK